MAFLTYGFFSQAAYQANKADNNRYTNFAAPAVIYLDENGGMPYVVTRVSDSAETDKRLPDEICLPVKLMAASTLTGNIGELTQGGISFAFGQKAAGRFPSYMNDHALVQELAWNNTNAVLQSASTKPAIVALAELKL